jgi:PAS domain S-box-containing protein
VIRTGAWLRRGAGRGVAAYLAAQATFAAGFFLLPSGVGKCLALVLTALVAALTVAVATQYRRPPRTRAWYALAGGLLLAGLGWSWTCGYPHLGGGVPAPTGVADALFLGAYALGGVAMVAMAGLRRRGDLIAVLDAAVLTVGMGVVLWVIVSEQPAAQGLSTSERLWAMAYPVADTVLLSVAARLSFAGVGGRRTHLLVAFAGLQTIGDVVYVVQVFQGTFRFGSPLFTFWFGAFAALGAASLLPYRQSQRGLSLRRSRLGAAAVAVAVAVLPALLIFRAIQGTAENVPLVAIATVAVSALVLVRFVIAAGESGSQVVREAVRRTSVQYVAGGLVLGLLPLSGLTYVAMHESQVAAREAVRERIAVSAAVVAEFVREEVQAIGTLTRTYATGPLLVASVSRPGQPDLDVVNRRLSSLSTTEPDLAAAALLDSRGRLLAVQPQTPELTGLVGRQLVAPDRALRIASGQGPVVGDPIVSAAPSTSPTVSVSHSVRDKWGRPAGVLVTEYGFGGIRSFSDRIADLQGVTVFVADRHRHLIAGPGSGGRTAVTIVDERISAALAGRAATVTGRGGEGPSTSSYLQVPALGWAVLTEQPDRVAFRQHWRLQARVVAAAVLLAQILLAGLIWGVGAEGRRREAESRLTDREEHLRGVLEAASDAYVSMDANGHVLAWNARAVEMFGYDRETALGEELAELVVPPELRAAHRQGLRRVARGGRSTILGERVSLEAVHADGHRFPVEIALWQSATSGPPTFNAFLRDETARRQHEEQLAAARDAAVAASRMKSEFVANMSHEIRTPMNGVLGMTSLLRDSDLDEFQQDYADTIANCAEALLTIIDDILDFSKIEAGKLELEAVDFELREIVEDVVGLLGAGARVRGVEMIALIDPTVPSTVHGDPHRLRQVLTNLVGNAVKYTEQGEIVVTVEPAAHGHPFLHFAVRDTGIGITAEQRIRLFDAFEQADASTTRRFGGTGLGLTISRRLVHLMGGSLGVDSSPGVGSTFFFDVPLPTAALTLPAESARRRSMEGVRALVVDDNPTNRAVLQHHLTSGSLLPTCIGDPVVALDHMRAAATSGDPYHVIVLDMEMPGMTGLELAHAVQADTTIAGTPLVMLTSSNMAGQRAAAEAAGVRALLTKPVRQEQLLARLAEVLSEHEEAQAAAGGAQPAGAAVLEAEPPGAADAEVTAADRREPAPTKVLVVEDNDVNRRVVTGMLTAIGYGADVARDGQEAIDKALSGDYAAILMDLQMPRVDGFEATRQIRSADSPRSNVPIIALTASALASDQEQCRSAGMDDFLSKPLRRDKLASILRQWADAGAGSDGHEEPRAVAGPTPAAAGAHLAPRAGTGPARVPAPAPATTAGPGAVQPAAVAPIRDAEPEPATGRVRDAGADAEPASGPTRGTEPVPATSSGHDAESIPATGPAHGTEHVAATGPAHGTERAASTGRKGDAEPEPATGPTHDSEPAPAAGPGHNAALDHDAEPAPATRHRQAPAHDVGPLPGAGPEPAVAPGSAATPRGSEPTQPVNTLTPAVQAPPGPWTAADDVLDQTVFADLVSLGPEMVTSLVTTYLGTAPDRLAGLKTAVETADLKTVARLAHALRGSSAAMAAHHLAALCADIERAARYGSGTVPELVEQADTEYARVVTALTAYIPVIPTQKIRSPEQPHREHTPSYPVADEVDDW